MKVLGYVEQDMSCVATVSARATEAIARGRNEDQEEARKHFATMRRPSSCITRFLPSSHCEHEDRIDHLDVSV